MNESLLHLLLLSVITGCFVTITVVFAKTAGEVRIALRRANTLLTGLEHAFSRTQDVVRHVESVVHRVRTFLTNPLSNGARSGPRRHVRRV